jgi:indolepyruvate ferredoxin oxidoreductase
VVNTHLMPTSDFVLHGQTDFGDAALLARVQRHAGDVHRLDATGLAEHLLGDAVGANLLTLGHAWQLGRVPVSLAAMERAIEMNAVAVEMNKRAFHWGRVSAAHPEAPALRVEATEHGAMDPPVPRSLDELVQARAEELTRYADGRLASRYLDRVGAMEAAERRLGGDDDRLTALVAKQYARVLLVKDEYEVARLYSDGRFAQRLAKTFEDGGTTRVHLAPPALPLGVDGRGRPRKIAFGPWMLRAFAVLARFRGLRNSWLDPFRFTADRQRELGLIATLEDLIDEIAERLDPDNRDAAVRLLESVDTVRGYGPVRAARDASWRAHLPGLLADFREPEVPVRLFQPGRAA